MFIFQNQSNFDTLLDTQTFHVSMKTSFYLRKDIKVQDKNPIYLQINSTGDVRQRIHLNLFVEEKKWHAKNQRVKTINGELNDINLLLDNISAKLTDIQTVYRLSDLPLTTKIMRFEFENKLSRVNFIAFFRNAIKEEASKNTHGTNKRYESVLKKLEAYQKEIAFNKLNISWFNNYRNHLKDDLKNVDTTIAANFAAIKKVLNLAKKNGIKLLFDLDDLYIGNTKGNRTYLSVEELKKCFEFYFSNYINPNYRLILGYFLFSCMNGLRISNVQALTRKELLSNDFSLVIAKSRKDRNLIINSTAKKIIEHDEDLFIKKYSDQHINDELKKIMIIIGIKKKVTFHVARHTFATLFLKAGGKVEKLQMILGHSAITETMVYSHIVQSEANEEMFLLDTLFKQESPN